MGGAAAGGQAAARADGAERGESGRGAGDGHAGHRGGSARGRPQPQPDGAAAEGRDHHPGARAFVAADRLRGPADRAGLRAAGGRCRPRDHGAPRCAAGPGVRAGRRRDHASTSPGCPPRWSPSTWPALRRARRPPPLYGPRCENGPSPNRSKADSTASANSRWARLRVSASNRRQPSDGSTSCSSTKRAPLRCARAYSNSARLRGRGGQRGGADIPELEVGFGRSQRCRRTRATACRRGRPAPSRRPNPRAAQTRSA